MKMLVTFVYNWVRVGGEACGVSSDCSPGATWGVAVRGLVGGVGLQPTRVEC